jgi:hypothetical protein
MSYFYCYLRTANTRTMMNWVHLGLASGSFVRVFIFIVPYFSLAHLRAKAHDDISIQRPTRTQGTPRTTYPRLLEADWFNFEDEPLHYDPDRQKRYLSKILGKGRSITRLPMARIRDPRNAGSSVWVVLVADGDMLHMVDTATKDRIKTWTIEGPTSYSDQDSDEPDILFRGTAGYVDTDDDGFVDRFYQGDLLGRLWRFDLDKDQYCVLFDAGRRADQSRVKASIVHRPAVMFIKGRYPMVFFGAGGGQDLEDHHSASFYALRDDSASCNNPRGDEPLKWEGHPRYPLIPVDRHQGDELVQRRQSYEWVHRIFGPRGFRLPPIVVNRQSIYYAAVDEMDEDDSSCSFHFGWTQKVSRVYARSIRWLDQSPKRRFAPGESILDDRDSASPYLHFTSYITTQAIVPNQIDERWTRRRGPLAKRRDVFFLSFKPRCDQPPSLNILHLNYPHLKNVIKFTKTLWRTLPL